jgi:hypothetical protein
MQKLILTLYTHENVVKPIFWRVKYGSRFFQKCPTITFYRRFYAIFTKSVKMDEKLPKIWILGVFSIIIIHSTTLHTHKGIFV